ncbi:MAG: hypothetical protein JXB34_02230 [Bacteroidales bacterium]|nr:hypothetical protein [Bacteroidales bacterium]
MQLKPNNKKTKRRFQLPVIAHFADRSVRFNNILEAERITGINYNLIFEACIGKLHKARNVYWEFEKGNHYLRYKSHYMRATQKMLEEGHKHH